MSSNSTCFRINRRITQIYLPTVYVAVFVFGLLANLWGLRSIFKNWSKLGKINIFALNLCMADILYLLTLPFLTNYYINNQIWIFGQPFCKLTRILFSINLYGSIGFLTCISVYRYLGIVHTLKVKGRITHRHSVAITALVWILVFLQSLPNVFFEKTVLNKTKCFDTTSDAKTPDYLKYSLGQTFFGFGIPLVIILSCYGHVAVTLASKKDPENSMLHLRSLRLVVVLTLLFSLCFIPFHIFRNLNLTVRVWKKQDQCSAWYGHVYIARQISEGLVCLNNVINPLVYLLISDKLLKKCFTCGWTCQKVSDMSVPSEKTNENNAMNDCVIVTEVSKIQTKD